VTELIQLALESNPLNIVLVGWVVGASFIIYRQGQKIEKLERENKKLNGVVDYLVGQIYEIALQLEPTLKENQKLKQNILQKMVEIRQHINLHINDGVDNYFSNK